MTRRRSSDDRIRSFSGCTEPFTDPGSFALVSPLIRGSNVSHFDRLLPERTDRVLGCAQKSLFAGISTGATGLEPATSGVTGLFRGYDDW